VHFRQSCPSSLVVASFSLHGMPGPLDQRHNRGRRGAQLQAAVIGDPVLRCSCSSPGRKQTRTQYEVSSWFFLVDAISSGFSLSSRSQFILSNVVACDMRYVRRLPDPIYLGVCFFLEGIAPLLTVTKEGFFSSKRASPLDSKIVFF
jgi:hypothetical protein